MTSEKIRHSEEVDEVLSYVPNWMISWGITLIFAIIILLLFISWFIKYPDVVVSEITITTQNQPIDIICKSDGVIEKVFVMAGQEVKINNIIAYMSNEANYKDVLTLIHLVERYSSILDIKREFPETLRLGRIQLSYNEFLNSYSNYWLNKENRPTEKEIIALKVQGKNSQILVKQLKQKQQLFQEDLQLTEKDFQRDTMLHSKGYVSDKDIEIKQINFLKKKRDYQDILNQISNIHISIAQIDKEIATLSNKNSEIAHSYKQTVLLKWEQLKGTIEGWKKDYLFISPIDGVVSFNSFVEDNIYLKKNDNVFTIIPKKGGIFEGQAVMPISRSGKVKIGQRVNIKLSNFPYGEYGMLVGKVRNISLTPSNDSYILKIALQNGLISTYGKELKFNQNMKGTAEIITEDLRLIERIFYQFRHKVNR